MPRQSFAVRTGRDAPAAVRVALRDRCSHLPRAVRDDLMLLLTELVTNAVRHSGAEEGDPIRIEMSDARDSVRVQVTDPGAGFDRPDELIPDLEVAGGLGLVLVDRLSREWGTRQTAAGSHVWFVLGHDREEWRTQTA